MGWKAPTEGLDSALQGEARGCGIIGTFTIDPKKAGKRTTVVSVGSERALRFRGVLPPQQSLILKGGIPYSGTFVPLFFALKEKWQDEWLKSHTVGLNWKSGKLDQDNQLLVEYSFYILCKVSIPRPESFPELLFSCRLKCTPYPDCISSVAI